jgi:hypothetical protein
MPVKEYKAGLSLEARAHELHESTGASQFHSLIHAALRVAGMNNFIIITRMFPEIHRELMVYHSSSLYVTMDMDLVAVARMAARYRQMLGIGIKLYEISTEIANATGGSVDDIHEVLSQHYNEIVMPNDEV